MYKLKNENGRVNSLLRTGNDLVKNNLAVSAAQHTEWFRELTDVDGEYLITNIRKEYGRIL